METQSLKQVYFENEDYKFEYERIENLVVIHCTVSNWKPSALKHGYQTFGKFLNDMEESGVTEVITISPNPRFCQLLGGRYMASIYKDEIKYEVFKWDLK